MQICTYWCVYVCAWKTDATIFIQNTKPNAKRMKKKSSQSHSQNNTRTGIKCRTMKIVYTLAHLYIFYNLRVCWHLVWTFISPTMNEPSSITWIRYVAHTTRLERKFSAFFCKSSHRSPIVACQMHAEYHTIYLVSHVIYIDSRLPHCVSWDEWSLFIIFVWRWNDVAFYCRWCSRVKHLYALQIMHTFDGLVACVFNAFGTGVSSLLNTQNAHSIFCVFRQIKIEEKLLRVSDAPRPFFYFYFYRYTIIIAFLWSLYMFVFLWICSLVCFLCDPSQASKQSELKKKKINVFSLEIIDMHTEWK